MKVETDENLIENLKVEKVNGELEIRTRSGVNLDPTDEIKVILTMPVLKSVRVSGASSINSEGKFTQNEDLAIEANGASEAEMDVRAPRLNLDASGASTLTIFGETRDYSAEATGASTLKAFDLRAENAVVRASGASTANVFSSISLSANASGASGIHYKGNPKLSSNASGASSVDKAD